MEIAQLQQLATQVRRDILRMVHQCKSGHPGGSLGCADFLTLLYANVMNHNPNFQMEGNGEDVFFLSNGHISPLFYSVLARNGYFETSELKTFRKLNSRLQGHPTTHEGLPGIRVSSGSLGQGLSVAIGTALSKKMNNDKSLVYCLMGDGEIQEGQIWEAAMFATHNHVSNLIAIVDVNGQQIDGPTENVLSLGNLSSKWTAFGWHAIEVNGHDLEALTKTLNFAKKLSGSGIQPIVILMKTVMGKGVDFMEGNHKWHGSPPSDEQLNTALNQLTHTGQYTDY